MADQHGYKYLHDKPDTARRAVNHLAIGPSDPCRDNNLIVHTGVHAVSLLVVQQVGSSRDEIMGVTVVWQRCTWKREVQSTWQ